MPDLDQLKQKIGQMIVVRTSGHLFDHQIRYPLWEATHFQIKQWITELNIGGVILLGGSAAEVSLKTQKLQNWATVPLLICADVEEGVGQRFTGGTWFPPPMALGKIAQKELNLAQNLTRQIGESVAKEALTIGINWILAPVVDVNNNPDNPVINIRAFGNDPYQVGQLGKAFIQGLQKYPVLSTAKHFPGHGNTTIDSHLELPILSQTSEELEQIELPPFQAAITANVDSIMTAHLLVKAWDNYLPVTLSKAILTDQLRKKLGFHGLIVTDALVMGGVTKQYSDEEIAIKAVEAGADILLMPTDPEVAINAIFDAVKSGRLTIERLTESSSRIAQAKQKISSFRRPQDIFNLSEEKSRNLVETILNYSLEKSESLPLAQLENKEGRNLIIIDDSLNCNFLDRQSPAITIPQQYGYELQLIDHHCLKKITKDNKPTLLQIFLRGNPFRGHAGLTPEVKKVYQKLINSDTIKGLIIYGSPYIKDWFLSQISPEIPYIFTYGQMLQSQKISCRHLFGMAEIKDPQDSNFGF